MTYLKWRDADGYEKGSRECLDLSAFAADLCKALDGKPISTNDRDAYARSSWQTVASSLCRHAGVNRDR